MNIKVLNLITFISIILLGIIEGISGLPEMLLNFIQQLLFLLVILFFLLQYFICRNQYKQNSFFIAFLNTLFPFFWGFRGKYLIFIIITALVISMFSLTYTFYKIIFEYGKKKIDNESEDDSSIKKIIIFLVICLYLISGCFSLNINAYLITSIYIALLGGLIFIIYNMLFKSYKLKLITVIYFILISFMSIYFNNKTCFFEPYFSFWISSLDIITFNFSFFSIMSICYVFLLRDKRISSVNPDNQCDKKEF